MRHNILFLFISMNLFILINTTTIYGEWTPKLLYEYIVSNIDYLSEKNYINNINYMIIDPENYLENADPSGLINKMKIIYDEYKINTYIILISDLNLIENNGDLNYEVERFVSYFNYLLQKGNPEYNDTMSLTTAFFINKRKMRMRTGKFLKEIITDEKALELLNSRRGDLRRQDYYNVVDGLLDDIINKYKFYKYSNYIFVTTLIFFISISYFLSKICNKPEKERIKKIKEFLKENKNKQINHIFNDSCIICLDNLEVEKENIKNKETSKEKEQEQEKEKEDISVLECGHRFHEKCIIEWLKKHNICPICREKMNFENNGNDNQNNESRVLGDNFNFIIDIQLDAYPQEITATEGNKITSDFNNPKSNDDSGFDNFDGDSGGATSDW